MSTRTQLFIHSISRFATTRQGGAHMDKELVRLESRRVRRAASIPSRSYVLPSSATTCSCMSEWWIGQQSCSGSVGCHAFQFSMSVSVCCLICCKGLFLVEPGNSSFTTTHAVAVAVLSKVRKPVSAMQIIAFGNMKRNFGRHGSEM